MFGNLVPGVDVHPFTPITLPNLTKIHGVYLHLFALTQLLAQVKTGGLR